MDTKGNILWQKPTEPVAPNTCPAVDKYRNIYVGSLSGTITCLTEHGNILWTYNVGSEIVSSLVIGFTSGYSEPGIVKVYCSSLKALLSIRFDTALQQPELLWRFEPEFTFLGSKMPSGFIAAPAYKGKNIVAAGLFGDIYYLKDNGDSYTVVWSQTLGAFSAIRPVTSQPVFPSQSSRVHYLYFRSNQYFYILDASNGSVLLRDYEVMPVPAPEGTTDAPLMANGYGLFFAGADGKIYGIGEKYKGTSSIQGMISGDFSGTKVFLEGAVQLQTEVDEDGTYIFDAVPKGNYLVTPSKQGIEFSPQTQSVSNSGKEDVTDVDFAATRVSPTIISASTDIADVPNDAVTPVTFFIETEGSVDTVWLDLSDIGGNTRQEMSLNSSSGIYELTTTVPETVNIGIKSVGITVDGMGTTVKSSMVLNVKSAISSSVTDQIYYVQVDKEGEALFFRYKYDCGEEVCQTLYFQVFKPSSSITGKPDYEEEMTREEQVLMITNVEAGKWALKVSSEQYGVKNSAKSLFRMEASNYDIITETAGSGIVLGYVYDAETGLPLDGVTLSIDDDDTEISTVTAEGYYKLSTGAGVISLTAKKQGYKDAVESVDLISGEQTEVDFYLLPSDFDDGTDEDCFLSALFGKTSPETNMFRRFRDVPLNKTDSGKELISRYYLHSPEVSSIIKQDVRLKNDLTVLFIRLFPVLNKIINGEKISITEKDRTAIKDCLNRIREKSSADLSREIDTIIDDLDKNSLL